MRQLGREEWSFTPLNGEVPHGSLRVGRHQTELPGAQINEVFALGETGSVQAYLIFSSDGIDFEEVLSITLADPALRILDQAWIGAPYSTALWDGARITGPGSVAFALAQDGIWRLTVLPRPEWRLPLPTADGWVWRGMRLRRHFRLERVGAAA
ncbi:MAG: hypothetical protein ACK5IP_14640 [Paracoccus sp. (in: a-proteobacteria)]